MYTYIYTYIFDHGHRVSKNSLEVSNFPTFNLIGHTFVYSIEKILECSIYLNFKCTDMVVLKTIF